MAALLDFPSDLLERQEARHQKEREDKQLYYIQDGRSFVGNSVLWWREGGAGYTTNLAEAMKVTGDWVGRDTDILWPVAEVDARATLQFDAQNFRDIKESK